MRRRNCIPIEFETFTPTPVSNNSSNQSRDAVEHETRSQRAHSMRGLTDPADDDYGYDEDDDMPVPRTVM